MSGESGALLARIRALGQLVIELMTRVAALEQRVAALEQANVARWYQ